MADDERCHAHVEGCCCDYHDEDWRRFAAEYGIELPEVDEVCTHHEEVRRG